MVRRALIAGVLVAAILTAATAHARRTVRVTLPECAPLHVDVTLLRELLEIELGDAEDGEIEVSIGGSLCGEPSDPIEATLRDPESEAAGSETFVLPAELDPRARSRALALAIAGRARFVLARAVAPVVAPVAAPVVPALVAEPEGDEDAGSLADRADALALPRLDLPALPDVLQLPPWIGIAIRGRIAPVLPSWALGLRVDVGASLDPDWSLRGEVFATWSRASAPEGDSDAVVIAGAGALGLTLHRDSAIELVAAVRVEAGALIAIGTLMGGTPGRTTSHPWGAIGGELGLVWWASRGLAMVADLAVSGVVLGTQIVSAPSGTQIDLSAVTIDLDVGVRVPL